MIINISKKKIRIITISAGDKTGFANEPAEVRWSMPVKGDFVICLKTRTKAAGTGWFIFSRMRQIFKKYIVDFYTFDLLKTSIGKDNCENDF